MQAKALEETRPVSAWIALRRRELANFDQGQTYHYGITKNRRTSVRPTVVSGILLQISHRPRNYQLHHQSHMQSPNLATRPTTQPQAPRNGRTHAALHDGEIREER